MSDAVLVAIVAAIPSTCGVIVSLFNRQRLGVVQLSVNGGLSDAKAEIVALKAEIRRLKDEFQ